MSFAMECIFCKVVKREKEEKIIYEDNNVIVFSDSNPRTPYHYLIVPKQHFHDFSDMMGKSPKLLIGIGKAVETVVGKLGMKSSWYTWGFHAGGKQSVDHVHAQLLSGMGKDQLVL